MTKNDNKRTTRERREQDRRQQNRPIENDRRKLIDRRTGVNRRKS